MTMTIFAYLLDIALVQIWTGFLFCDSLFVWFTSNNTFYQFSIFISSQLILHLDFRHSSRPIRGSRRKSPHPPTRCSRDLNPDKAGSSKSVRPIWLCFAFALYVQHLSSSSLQDTACIHRVGPAVWCSVIERYRATPEFKICVWCPGVVRETAKKALMCQNTLFNKKKHHFHRCGVLDLHQPKINFWSNVNAGMFSQYWTLRIFDWSCSVLTDLIICRNECSVKLLL